MNPTGPTAIFEGNPYEQHTDSRHQYGAKMFMSNGDIYRYTKGASTDFIAGYLYTGLSREDNHQNITVAATTAVGATSITVDIGATAVDANEYDQGFLIFNDNSPEGEFYGITSHGTGTSAEVTFNLTPALKTISTVDSSEIALVRNTWNKPAISQLIAEPAAGIAIQDWDVSVAEFGWLKTRGMASALADGTITVGYKVTISDATDGAVGLYSDVDAEVVVGQMMDAGVSGEFNPINLLID